MLFVDFILFNGLHVVPFVRISVRLLFRMKDSATNPLPPTFPRAYPVNSVDNAHVFNYDGRIESTFAFCALTPHIQSDLDRRSRYENAPRALCGEKTNT